MGKEMWIPMKDGHEVFLCNWIEEFKPPRAILQLAHGMAEHSARYQEFAMELAALGIGVYANDHRGHGRTGEKSGTMGHLNNENGFERVVADLKEINEFIHLNHPDIPVFLMGHSMIILRPSVHSKIPSCS
ncbi:serine aminopeptidase domain-containing protein [Halalkalibacter akibai]|uniref:Lysophospholipase n=1 Tax=Halalkalibacter akibai (strain ATCC 43226 / DSM 21942 / CIP 109018 / JCM 9157 / 1139) TaxID=1236973 RepID=W4QS16_HALA3|nr:alpha/beta hydrolase [Halalkalibacter akibai]GAE34727.1 lysophospholipase [Halalkalibacter akibai JCM 9157]